MLKEEVLNKIKNQVGSNGKEGWPVAVRDRIGFPHASELRVTDANVAVTFLWTMRDAILPKLEKNNLAIATNFYTPAGLQGMVRNILGNPFIRYVILLGEEYSSKAKDDQISELTSANAIRAFFEKGVNSEGKIEGFESSVKFDKNIPLELIEKIRENVELIDLNKKMPLASMDEKIQEANILIKILERKDNFLEEPLIFEYEKTSDSFPYEGGPLIVHGKTIPECWIKMIHNIYRYGKLNLMNAETDRWIKEINNMTVVIEEPQNMDLFLNPFLVPLTKEKIEAYKQEILSPILPEGKAYTYGNKLRAYHHPSSKQIKDLVNFEGYKDYEFGKGDWLDANVKYIGEDCEIDQLQDMIDVLKRDAYSKSVVALTWHPADELMRKHKSSPCLIFLQAMVQDDKLNLTVFFRSHDMTQGWPENTYGCAAIQKYIADRIGYEPGILTMISGSAQIYNNYYAQVEEMLKKYSNQLNSCTDARGNFLIKLDEGEIKVILTHPLTGEELETFTGTNAIDLKDKIAKKVFSLQTAHAIDVGTEVAKAEYCLKNNLKYEQDRPIPSFVVEDKKKCSLNVLKEGEIGTRPNWDEYFMKVAISIASRSSCVKVHSGSVIVYNKRIVGVDSEMNALANTNLTIHKGFTIYTTILPCHACAKTLISHGVERVVFKKTYEDSESQRTIELFTEAGISVEKLDLSPERLVDIDFGHKELKFDVWSDKEKEKIKELLKKD
jgi:thymidylate synthase